MLQTGDTFVHKATGELDIVRYTVPQDTYSDAAQDPINRIYTGHTLANVIVSKMLTIVARDIVPADISQLAKVLIAYKVPHPLIKQVVYTVQLPERDPVFQAYFAAVPGPDMAEKLVHLAIQELLVELSSVKAVLLA
jgi:DNA-directed RNA polymerase subunit L